MVRVRGFTLIEILATIAIATVMIGPIFYMLSSGSRWVYKSADKTYAVLAASDLIEVVRGTDFSVLPVRDEPYAVDEIREKIATGDNLRRNLVFNHVYAEKFSIGAFVQSIPEGEMNQTMGAKAQEIRMITVVVQWENVLTKKAEEVRLTSFYMDSRVG